MQDGGVGCLFNGVFRRISCSGLTTYPGEKLGKWKAVVASECPCETRNRGENAEKRDHGGQENHALDDGGTRL